MEAVTFTDNEGCEMKLQRIHGALIPPIMKTEKGYTELLKLQARDDDVIVCGYPKSGAHWMTEVISMLLRGSTDYLKQHKVSLMLENTRRLEDGDLSTYEDLESPRVLNSHLPLALLPPDFLKKKTKFIYLCRNPKDVVVSFYNFLSTHKMFRYNGSFDAFLHLYLDGHAPYGCAFDNLIQWQKDQEDHPEMPFLIVYYEDTKQDFMKQAHRLCEFFEIKRDDEFLTSVKTACSFDKMKASGEERAAADPYGPKQAASFIYRKGEVGDWKNWFTVAQSEMFDEISRKKLQGLNFDFKYQL